MRQKWLIAANTDATRVNDAIGDKARALGKQADTVAFDDALETQRRIYVDPNTTDDEKAKARADIEGSIATGLKTGLLTPDQADARRKQYVEDANFSRAKLQADTNPSSVKAWNPSKPNNDPVGEVAAAGNIAQARSYLLTKTNKGPDSVNGFQPQFATKLATLFQAAPPEIASGLGIYSGYRSPEHQAELWQAALQKYGSPEEARKWVAPPGHSEHNRGDAADLGYNGQSLKDAPQNVIDWLHENAPKYGLKFPLGNENWHIEDSSTRGGSPSAPTSSQSIQLATNAPDWFNQLSPEQKQVAFQLADTKQKQQQVEARGNIETVVQNAPAAIQNTGTYNGAVPTQEQFIDAYGPNEGQQKYNNFSASLDAAQTAFSFRTMSASEIQQAVEADRPTSSGNDAFAQDKRYEAVSTAAQQTLAARKADPATYTMQAFPNVQQAWSDAATSGDYQSAMAATAAAQRQLGMDKLELLPKAVANQAVTTFKSPDATDQQRINAISGLVFATPDQGQRQAVFNQLVDAGLPAMTEGVMEAASRGDQGAANRLLQAAITDPAKLPRNGEIKPTDIDSSLYSTVWAPGQIGDAAYGVAYGDAASLERAQHGSDLMKKAVQLRISQGQDLDSAVAGATKDLFGDMKVYNGSGSVSANLPVPTDTDTSLLTHGLDASKTAFKAALEAQRERILASSNASLDDGARKILEATTMNRVDDVLNNGVFVQAGNGVGLRDPYTGTFVTGENGQPITFSVDKILQMGRDIPKAATPQDQWQQGQSVVPAPTKTGSNYLSGQTVTMPPTDAAQQYLRGETVGSKPKAKTEGDSKSPFDQLSTVERGFLGALSTAEQAGIGGTKLKLYNDIIQRGRTAPITENDLQPDEQAKLKALVLKQGKPEGKIDYKDYLGSGVSEDILGGFRYKVDDNGAVHITDTYDFNKSKGDSWDDNALMQALSAFASPKSLAAAIGRKVAPDSKSGIPVSITLK